MRRDFKVIMDQIDSGSRLIDIGCNDGQLLEALYVNKDIRGHGIELDNNGVTKCAKKGLSVVQGNADYDLVHYPDKCYDYAVSIQVLQATQHPKNVLQEMLRIANEVIIAIPNFGHWYNRYHLLMKGRMPVSQTLSYQWYETPNIHFCTIRDMVRLCDELECEIKETHFLSSLGELHVVGKSRMLSNLFATHAIFRLG